jgi:hypothetical protein
MALHTGTLLKGKLMVKLVSSEKKEADINMKNALVNLLNMLAKNVPEGNLLACQNWEDIVREIETHEVFFMQALV